MDETSAITLCLKHQDPTGFEYLVKKYRREAFMHALSLLGNQEDAADACQDSFARAFAALPRVSHLDSFYPWFYRILRNRCLNMISRRKTIQKHQQESKCDPLMGVDNETPISIFEKKEEEKTVWQILERLNPEFREILILKYLKGNNYDEIAQMLDIPRGTVMSRLYYARKSFKEVYGREAGVPDSQETR